MDIIEEVCCFTGLVGLIFKLCLIFMDVLSQFFVAKLSLFVWYFFFQFELVIFCISISNFLLLSDYLLLLLYEFVFK